MTDGGGGTKAGASKAEQLKRADMAQTDMCTVHVIAAQGGKFRKLAGVRQPQTLTWKAFSG